MDISDIIGANGHMERPVHPDMDRIIEISMQMLADMNENAGNPAAQERLWRKAITDCVDFDSLSYKAVQEAISLFGIVTGTDWRRIQSSPETHLNFVRVIQAFYDGFLIGSKFEQRGGKFDGTPSRRPMWPETDEERVSFVDWQTDVDEGNTHLGFRDWLENQEEND